MKIEKGKFYRTKSGLKVGPATPNEGREVVWDIPLNGAFLGYHADGTICISERGYDIVAEWSDAPLPYGHVVVDGETVDLTAITTPFGLLSEAVQEALRDHGGPYEVYHPVPECSPRWYKQETTPRFESMARVGHLVIRVRPKPEPERRTLTLYGKVSYFSKLKAPGAAIRITTTLTDGQWPLGTFWNERGQTIVVEVEG